MTRFLLALAGLLAWSLAAWAQCPCGPDCPCVPASILRTCYRDRVALIIAIEALRDQNAALLARPQSDPATVLLLQRIADQNGQILSRPLPQQIGSDPAVLQAIQELSCEQRQILQLLRDRPGVLVPQVAPPVVAPPVVAPPVITPPVATPAPVIVVPQPSQPIISLPRQEPRLPEQPVVPVVPPAAPAPYPAPPTVDTEKQGQWVKQGQGATGFQRYTKQGQHAKGQRYTTWHP